MKNTLECKTGNEDRAMAGPEQRNEDEGRPAWTKNRFQMISSSTNY